ncbi:MULTISPECIES: helix-turn-helix transcriptional regulator [unclassified Nocardiopsis]|uniref:ArsR/SmtB family transcription factor n=1 Tax=unclassified Nocardiopsis TaxID=2649073 RepID=UPI00135B3288|nr:MULTISPECIES: helix-turn-helix domain-containing protein [unclassified Nocardiopsis]
MAERTTERRLADLEARVAALEERAAGEPVREGGAEEAPRDAFFALNALREHATGRGAVVFAGVVRGEDGGGALEWQQGLPVERLAGADWSRLAAGLDALGHPVRLRLLHAVWEGASTVAELAERSDFGTTGQIYHHVNQLAAAGWVTTVRRGHYAVPPERVVPLLTILTAAGGTV